MLIELHMLQNFPPSNLNRDDIGQPKDCEFGGYRRARISSQCIKRVTRLHPLFAQYTGVPPSLRTKLVFTKLADAFVKTHQLLEDDAHRVAVAFARHYSGKLDEKDKNKEKTAALLYLSEEEIRRTAKQLHAEWDSVLAETQAAEEAPPTENRRGKKKDSGDGVMSKIVKELIRETQDRTAAPDIALFGRMLADKPETNIDAACQVAHVLSTHAVTRMEIDYFTAVDDVQEEPGAGFLDIAYFNSACFYRYSCVDWTQLVSNLKDAALARKTVEAYLRASEAAIPSGKKNSTAPQCRPSLMLAVVRQPQSVAWSLVNAFARPVSGKRGGIVEESAQRMAAYFDDLCEFYGMKSISALALAARPHEIDVEQLPEVLRTAHQRTLDTWVGTVTSALPGAA
jgi:CRISPR system Cascade subunit CasC